MRKADFLTGIFLIILSIFFIIEAFKMPVDPAYGIYAFPGITPIFLASILLILSIYLVIRSKVNLIEILRNMSINKMRNKEFQNLILAGILMLIYVFLLKKIPFYILTFLFIFVFSYIFYRKKPIFLLILSGVVTFAIIMLFSKLFLIPMP